MGKIYFQLIGFAVFTGATFNLAKYTIHYFSAASAAGWRFGIAAFLMIIILSIRKKLNWGVLKKKWPLYIIIGMIGVFGFNVLFFTGLKYTSPLNGSLIMATNPLVTSILAYFLLNTAITKRQVIGILFALAGVILVLTHGSWHMLQSQTLSKGDLFILLGNVCWALYGILSRKYLKTISSLENTTYTMVIGAIFLNVFAFVPSNQTTLAHPSLYAWIAILFMAIFTSVIGYLWWNEGMEKVGVNQTSLFFNLVPVVTMIISVVMGSAVSIYQILGTLLVIIGVLSASGSIKGKKQIEAPSL